MLDRLLLRTAKIGNYKYNLFTTIKISYSTTNKLNTILYTVIIVAYNSFTP